MSRMEALKSSVRKVRNGHAEPGSLSEEAYKLIRYKILRGDYTLGAVLSRRRLAAEFQMSFLPITEALQQLENDGLVESKPRLGTRVRIPTAEDIRGHYMVREALECQAVRLFSGSASAEERDEIRRMAAHVDALYGRVAEEKNNREFIFRANEYHMGFHMRIAEFTGCTELSNAIEKNQLLIFNWFYDLAAELTKLPPHFHFDLSKHIGGHNPEKADLAMRYHIRYGLEHVVRRMEQYKLVDVWRLRRTNPATTRTGQWHLPGGGVI